MNVLRAALGAAVGSSVRSGQPPPDDPPPPPPGTVNSFSTKLQAFGSTLSGREKSVMNWLMDRAARSAPGFLRGGPSPTLRQALGIAAFGSRAAGAGGNTWMLRFN
jgi:hypothetical protein